MIKIRENYPAFKIPFAFKNADAYTIGRTIYFKKKRTDYKPFLFWHEMCHVCQYEKYGKAKFFYTYFIKEFFRSYRKKSFEKEAYTVQTKQDLLKLYPQYSRLISSAEQKIKE